MRDPIESGSLSPFAPRWAGASRWAEMMAPLVVALGVGVIPLPTLDDAADWPPEADPVVALNVAGVVPAPAVAPFDGSTWVARRTGDAPAAAVESAAVAAIPSAPFGTVATRGGSSARLSREQNNMATFISRNYRIAVDQASQFVSHAYRAARDARIDPHLVLAVMSVESRFDPRARSPRGAQGLMQVVTKVHADRFQPFGGMAAAFDPMANIRVGTEILKEYIHQTGSPEAGLKFYVGAANANSDGGYGSKVLAERAKFAAVAAGRAQVDAAPAGRAAQSSPTARGASGGAGEAADGATAPVPGRRGSSR